MKERISRVPLQEQKPQNPIQSEGVLPGTVVFLRKVVEYKLYEALDVRTRNTVGLYYGTKASLSDLRAIAGVKASSAVNGIVKRGLRELWEAMGDQYGELREELQNEYGEENILRFKQGYLTARQQKVSRKAIERQNEPSYIDAKREELLRKWKDPEHRKKRLEGVKERRYAGLSPEQQQVFNFIKRNRKQITWVDDKSIKRIENYLGMHSNLKPAQKHWRNLFDAVDAAMKKISSLRYEELGVDKPFYDLAIEDGEQILSQGIISREELAAIIDYVQGKRDKKPSEDLWNKLSLAYVRCKSGMK